MKKLTVLLFAVIFSLPALATSDGRSGQMGPLVDCQMSDGTSDYIPKDVCKMRGGTAH